MSHGPSAAAVLNLKFWSDALHTFVSGLRKPLRLAVFPAQPKDISSALALAQEAEAANNRCAYAASLAKFANEKKPLETGSQHNQKPGNGQKSAFLFLILIVVAC